MKSNFRRVCILSFFSMLAFLNSAQATKAPTDALPAISARSPEVLASYDQADDFVAGLSVLKPKLQSICKNLLDSQLKLQQSSNSWKMYSLYEMFDAQHLMTAPLLRVGTVTELAGAIPQYTDYRPQDLGQTPLENLRSGSILIADKGAACGPDPLAVVKGAYFMKCGEFLIGSGLIPVAALNSSTCLNLRLLVNPDL